MTALALAPAETLAVDLIDESPLNPRTQFRRVDELAASLRSQGQLDPILVRPHPTAPGRYELVNGARRYRAAKSAGLTSLVARVRTMTDGEALDIMLATGGEGNADPLTPLEEAAGYEAAMRIHRLTLDQVASRYGRDRVTVHRRLSLLQLPEVARLALEAGDLPATTAWLIARIPGEAKREEAAKAIVHSAAHEGVMPFRTAQVYIEQSVCRPLKGAPFDVKDADLVPSAGACAKWDGRHFVGICPFHAGADRETYGDISNPHTCMSPECFARKVEAARKKVLDRAQSEGKRPLPPEENEKVFPKGGEGASWKSNYVRYDEPPPADILKPEVENPPTFQELCEGRDVPVYVGFDQHNRAVDLVRIDEAVTAADLNERAIFRDDFARRKQLNQAKPENQKAAEEAHRRQVAKLERVRRKKEQAAAEWLLELYESVQDAQHLADLSRHLYQRAKHASSAEDVGFILGALTEEGVETEDPYAELDDFFGAIPEPRRFAFVVALIAAPTLRLDGADAEWVSAWHRELVAPSRVAAEPQDNARLSQVAKAHTSGMSSQEIARSFGLFHADVCGMLELDVRTERNVVTQLRQEVEEAFERQGLRDPREWERLIKFATGIEGGLDALTTPEQFRQVLATLSRTTNAPPPDPTPAEEKEDDDDE